jgi:N6-adenosine-specific RNA methylase IME4
MPCEEISGLRLAEVAAADSVLLMWVTDPMLKHSLAVIDAWGFVCKTVGFYWCKTRGDALFLDPAGCCHLGTGFWIRANPKQCLLATRGAPQQLNSDVRKLVVAPVREHSRKPNEV